MIECLMCNEKVEFLVEIPEFRLNMNAAGIDVSLPQQWCVVACLECQTAMITAEYVKRIMFEKPTM